MQVARAGAARRWTPHRARGKAGASLESVVTNPEIRSATRGRLRLRWGALADGSVGPEAARERLGRVVGILDLDVYPRTGSLVARFDPGRSSAAAILAALAGDGIDGDAAGPAPRSRVNGALAAPASNNGARAAAPGDAGQPDTH